MGPRRQRSRPGKRVEGPSLYGKVSICQEIEEYMRTETTNIREVVRAELRQNVCTAAFLTPKGRKLGQIVLRGYNVLNGLQAWLRRLLPLRYVVGVQNRLVGLHRRRP